MSTTEAPSVSLFALRNLRLLPAGETARTLKDPCWHLFGYYPRTRDVYRLVRCYYNASDPKTPPTEQEITKSTTGSPSKGDCTDLALIYGDYWNDMVNQFREARGRPRRRKAA